MAQTTPQANRNHEANGSATLICPHCSASYPPGGMACTNCSAATSPTGYTRNGGFYMPPNLPVRVVQQPKLERPHYWQAQTAVAQSPEPLWRQLAIAVLLLISAAALILAVKLVLTSVTHPCPANESAYCALVPPTPMEWPGPTITPSRWPNGYDPKQQAQAFITIFSGEISQYRTLAQLFDSAYGGVDQATIACAALNTRETYGDIVTSTIYDPVITGTVALVTIEIVSVSRAGEVNFYLKGDIEGNWKIDRIIGWIGGDITPDNPVGDSQSCLALTPTPQSPSR